MAEALYRKYRPQTFEDVVGQEHIERTLRNAISTDKVSHAYLFTGPRGTGKTTTARILAKALLCEKGPTPEPDGTCEDCELIAVGEHPDVYELDAASRTGVENVREEIIGRVNYAPTRGRYKVYIIDEVHMLSVAAFNALLKTLEEPPDHVVFVLCTTDPQKVPETIQSRCQRFDFRRISSEELISRLGAICEMEGVDYEGDALDLIAHRANGGMRDALTSLEQLITFSNGSVTSVEAERLLGALDSSDLADIVKAIGTRDVAACFRWTSEYVETGADLAQITKDLAEHIRDMYVMSLAGADVAIEVTEAGRRELEAELVWFGPDRLSRLLAVLGDLIAELKTSTNQRLSFEIALTRMIRPESDITLSSLAERIEQLERNGVAASMPLPSAAADRSVQGAPSGDAPSSASVAGQRPQQPQARAQQLEPRPDPAASDAPAGQPVAPTAAEPSAPANASPSTAHGNGDAPTLKGRDVMQVWNAVLANLKKQNEAYCVLFMNTFVSSVDDGARLLIEFAQGNKFAYNTAKGAEAREALERALSSAGVAGLPYEIAQSDKAAQPTQVQPAQSRTAQAQPRSQAQEGAQARPEQQNRPQPAATEPVNQPAKGTAAPMADDPFAETPAPDDYLPREAYEDLDAPSATQPAQQQQQQSPSQPSQPETPRSQAPSARDADPSPTTTTDGDQPDAEPTMNEINDNLASMFGEGVVFEEVK